MHRALNKLYSIYIHCIKLLTYWLKSIWSTKFTKSSNFLCCIHRPWYFNCISSFFFFLY